ncbi:hypothetical protein [Corynebacterium sp. sy039]|uniref:hypothetical protein n=1 Tax=Corynebacterium sp. sy039 TaxID=2599641 RepID=UPI0011B5AC6B|nr:hypothetical protein [Corynebacterium sp. sy039]QDZ43436.1 hypothetical protein FQV43_10010 [Corynebacterium sp. sy039]
MRKNHTAHRLARHISATMLICALGSSTAIGLTPIPRAQAEVFPLSPTNPDVANLWVNPELRVEDTSMSLELHDVPSKTMLGDSIKIGVTITNHSDHAINTSDLVLSVSHADAEQTLAGTRKVLVGDPSFFPYQAQEKTVDSLANTVIQPGKSIEISLPITTTGDAESLNLLTAGFYPILIKLSDEEGKYTTSRFTLSVSEPPQAPTPPAENKEPETKQTATQPEHTPAQLSIIYPITTNIDILPGETGDAPKKAPLILRNENLIEQLKEQGRVDKLLDVYEQAIAAHPQLAHASCVALDPQLVDTLSRMQEGYQVADTRPSVVSKKQRLRDSWGLDTQELTLAEGKGAAEAKKTVARLKELAKNSCTIALPWANTDLNAVAATNNSWLMREATLQGKRTLEKVLDAHPLDVLIAPSGYIEEKTAHNLGFADSSALNNELEHSADLAEEWDTQQKNTAPQNPDRNNSSSSSLEETRRSSVDSATHPTPAQPVRVVVADNSLWQVPQVDQFSYLAPQIYAISFDSSLAASLATMGDNPQMIGYGNTATRIDPYRDSLAARNATADAALRQSIATATKPVLAMLPTSISDPSQLLDTAAQLLAENEAQALAVESYMQLDDAKREQLEQLKEQQDSQNDSEHYGSPFDDPTVLSETEIMRAKQQADYIDDLTSLMINDKKLALSPYNFTAPLRRDILRALTHSGRDTIRSFDESVNRAYAILDANRDTLTQLRNSVGLLPPGNVYTRISDSSPILIVAQNGLPLPVNANIQYNGPAGTSVDVPDSLIIPAKGSITVSMTAELATDNKRTDLSLWLATPQNAAISPPVTIGVQTRSGIFGSSMLTIIMVFGLTALLLGRVVLRRRKVHHTDGSRSQSRQQSGRVAWNLQEIKTMRVRKKSTQIRNRMKSRIHNRAQDSYSVRTRRSRHSDKSEHNGEHNANDTTRNTDGGS